MFFKSLFRTIFRLGLEIRSKNVFRLFQKRSQCRKTKVYHRPGTIEGLKFWGVEKCSKVVLRTFSKRSDEIPRTSKKFPGFGTTHGTFLEHSGTFHTISIYGSSRKAEWPFHFVPIRVWKLLHKCSRIVPNVPTAELNHVNIRHKYSAFRLVKMISNVLEHSCNPYGTPNCLLGDPLVKLLVGFSIQTNGSIYFGSSTS